MRIAITLGDPNGIGPEIAIKAAQHFAAGGRIKPLLVGDGFVIEETANRLGLDATPAFIDAPSLDPAGYAPGTLDPRAGKATVAYAAAAVRLALDGKVDAVVGCPHSETAVNRAGIVFSGYPGLIADLTGTPREKSFMMLAARDLRIVHATLHESVGNALARLRAKGIAIDGPVGADLLLSQRKHDFYLAMFHDQGHIPIKLISPLRASAMTIGVPILFASVAHGCAFDIAGQGIADATGVIETLEMLAGAA